MDFFNFCWGFQKFPFFCVTLYIAIYWPVICLEGRGAPPTQVGYLLKFCDREEPQPLQVTAACRNSKCKHVCH